MEDSNQEKTASEPPFVFRDGDGKFEFIRHETTYLQASRAPEDQDVLVKFSIVEGVGFLPFATIIAKTTTTEKRAIVQGIEKGDKVRAYGFSSGKWVLLFEGLIHRMEIEVDNEAPSFGSTMQVRSVFAEQCGRPISWCQSSTTWRETLSVLAKECGFSKLVCNPKSAPVLDDQIDICGQCDTSFGALKLLSFMLDLSVAPDGRDGTVEFLPIGAVSFGVDPLILNLDEVKSYKRNV